MDVLKTILSTLGSIVALFLLCRLIGHRQISQMSMFDYINSICIGSAAVDFATGLENWHRPFTAMLIYGFVTALINILTCKNFTLRKLLNGKSLILFENGNLYKANLYRAKLDTNEFLTRCRAAGYFDLSQLQAVIMETTGQLSFLPLSIHRPLSPADLTFQPVCETPFVNLILDGKVLYHNLEATGHTMEWLKKQLHSQGIGQISQVFLASCDQGGRFIVYKMLNEPVDRPLFE